MARSLNKATLIGNLGADPEVRSTNAGTRVATLSVATSRRWTSRAGDPQEKTEWHRVVCWDKLAEICERYLSKGDRVYIEGRIEYRQWEGQDGQTRYTTEIRALDMIMLGSGGGREREGYTSPRSAPEGSDFSEFSNRSMAGEDDLPF
ncbi:single-stranded DNA-binding protein [Candidatus Palauibacter sp.]|uniref:single-stranded DNA-binding protein n=1 Tax=Candidatus Palauibacter sp. TaxID=3101350 RepID=UPI003B01FC3E